MENKVAIITGAGSGIGRAVALHMAGLGAAIVVADRNPDACAAVVREIEGGGGRAHPVEMDLGKAGDAARTVDAAVAAFGRLDILVNCAAALGRIKPFTEVTPAEWEEVMRTNVTGTFLLTQSAVRQMIAQASGGAIVNVLTIQIYMPLPGHTAYCASKGALATLTRALAVDLADHGIRVNGVAAASVYTPSVTAALGMDDARAIDNVAATLLGRMGRPDEIANVVAFLASDDARYVTGAIIPVDGGRLLSRKPDPFLSKEKKSTP